MTMKRDENGKKSRHKHTVIHARRHCYHRQLVFRYGVTYLNDVPPPNWALFAFFGAGMLWMMVRRDYYADVIERSALVRTQIYYWIVWQVLMGLFFLAVTDLITLQLVFP